MKIQLAGRPGYLKQKIRNVLDVAAAAGLESVPTTFPAEIADSWERLRDAIDKEGLWQRARVASVGQSNGWKAFALAASVAAVLFADTYLGFPDFRAVERTYALLTQLAGRAGRGDVAGKVVIQSFHPHHYAIRAALG